MTVLPTHIVSSSFHVIAMLCVVQSYHGLSNDKSMSSGYVSCMFLMSESAVVCSLSVEVADFGLAGLMLLS